MSYIATTLFVVHPANSEAVSWISGSPHILGRLFTLLTLISYVAYEKTKDKKMLIVSVIVYSMCLLFLKTPWAITTPIIIVAVDLFIIQKKLSIKKAKEYSYFFVPLFIYLFIYLPTQVFQRLESSEINFAQTHALSLLVSWALTIQKSVTLLLTPIQLSFYTDTFIASLGIYFLLFLSVMFLSAVLYVTWKNKAIFGLIACIYIATLPSFSPVGIGVGTSERYFYLSTAFFAMILGLLILKIEKTQKIKNFALIATIILFSLYSLRTILRTNDWKSDKNLSIATQKTAPHNFKVYVDLGNAYHSENDFENALVQYNKALFMQPDYPITVSNIGIVYLRTGNLHEAQKYLLRSYELDSTAHIPPYGLGVIEYEEGNYDKAREYFEKALHSNPQFGLAQKALDELDKMNSK